MSHRLYALGLALLPFSMQAMDKNFKPKYTVSPSNLIKTMHSNAIKGILFLNGHTNKCYYKAVDSAFGCNPNDTVWYLEKIKEQSK